MTNSQKNNTQIPPEFQHPLLFFQNQVNEQFGFLKDFGFILDKEALRIMKN